jgi:hypothetical protein
MNNSTDNNTNLCAVFLCDKAYFHKFLYTCNLLLTNGNYKGSICLVIGDDLLGDDWLNHQLILQNNILIKHFPSLSFPPDFLQMQYTLVRTPHWVQKLFQYHKLYLFDVFFKQWDFIFYLDCGITIFSDITPILNARKSGVVLAHSDAYPIYEWKLHNQFDKNQVELFSKLDSKYNLNIDYCQTTIMLYDTSIIEETTFSDLYSLMLEWPISLTNDQGIIALYFTNIKPKFEQIQTRDSNGFFYDYLSRGAGNRYIMLKSA